MAICALAVTVGAATAGIYTLTTPNGRHGATLGHPPTTAPRPPAPDHRTSAAPTTTSTTAPPPAEPPAPETSDPETIPTEPTSERTSEPPERTRTTEPDPDPEDELLDLINEARDEAGCDPVSTDARLTQAATAHSEDMSGRDYFSHIGPDGSTFVGRALREGYLTPAAENIAVGQRDAEQVMRNWMSSPGHRKNILDCSLTTVGLGVNTDGWYWTQDFGR